MSTPQSLTQGDVFLNFKFARPGPQQRSSWLTRPDCFVLRNFKIDGQDRDGIFALKTKFFSDFAHEGMRPIISVEAPTELDLAPLCSRAPFQVERKGLTGESSFDFLGLAHVENLKVKDVLKALKDRIESKKFLKDQPQNEVRVEELWIECVRHKLLSEKDFEVLNTTIGALIEECTSTNNKECGNEDEKIAKIKKLKKSFKKLCQEVAHEQLCFAFKLIDIVAPILEARVWLDLKGDSLLKVFERKDYKEQHIKNICKLTSMYILILFFVCYFWKTSFSTQA
jgi:hypothetical protein